MNKFQIELFQSDEGPKNSFLRRIFANPESLKSLKLCTGDVVALNAAQSTRLAVGVAWPSSDVSPGVLLVSRSVSLTVGLDPGQTAFLSALPLAKNTSTLPALRQAKEAASIHMRELTTPPADTKADWLTLYLRECLVDLKYITRTQTVEIMYEGRTRRFVVSSITTKRTSNQENIDELTESFDTLTVDAQPQLWSINWDVTVSLASSEHPKLPLQGRVETLVSANTNEAYASVGGLDRQIDQIRDLLDIPLTHPDLFRHFGLKPPRGVLLHGPPGTGKTHLARAIASSTNATVLVINGPELSSAYHGETEAKLRQVFNEAREKSPCIVVLDEVDALAPRREDSAGNEVEKRVVATLLTILDGMHDESDKNTGRVVVIGTTNRPNAIDPALRRPGRFDREFEIGIPDSEARYSILQVLLKKTPHSISEEELRVVASRAHGYVGADLSAVVREAGTIAIKRWLSSNPQQTVPSNLQLTASDLSRSLPYVRPSAMRSVFFESPPIRYSDIGGQAAVIQKLREAVEWPLLHPETFKRLGVRPTKGLLLYGPPGCSKTILARACACESEVNFVAVKGPELLNKFVGESERAVREIFRKARAAAPSIIFFDEIDAFATSRSSDSDSQSSREGVLTSLLNEMDGVQELLGVTIIAATNRPEVIDSALMRPGRLDRILYVGPPDQAGREEILKIRMSKMSVDPNIDVSLVASLSNGCSGAEINALCQEAALMTMKKDMEAPYVPMDAFIHAAKNVPKQIIPSMLEKFERWRMESGVQSI